jgi:hypothetical protein
MDGTGDERDERATSAELPPPIENAAEEEETCCWCKEEAVTPCTRDYVEMNGWLSKGCNRLTSGTDRNLAV